jgi:carboxyl-terminal processing protease
MKRMESKGIYEEIMNVPFDYSIDESFNTDYDKAPYAKNTAELTERWRKQIKLSPLFDGAFESSRKQKQGS